MVLTGKFIGLILSLTNNFGITIITTATIMVFIRAFFDAYMDEKRKKAFNSFKNIIGFYKEALKTSDLTIFNSATNDIKNILIYFIPCLLLIVVAINIFGVFILPVDYIPNITAAESYSFLFIKDLTKSSFSPIFAITCAVLTIIARNIRNLKIAFTNKLSKNLLSLSFMIIVLSLCSSAFCLAYLLYIASSNILNIIVKILIPFKSNSSL